MGYEEKIPSDRPTIPVPSGQRCTTTQLGQLMRVRRLADLAKEMLECSPDEDALYRASVHLEELIALVDRMAT